MDRNHAPRTKVVIGLFEYLADIIDMPGQLETNEHLINLALLFPDDCITCAMLDQVEAHFKDKPFTVPGFYVQMLNAYSTSWFHKPHTGDFHAAQRQAEVGQQLEVYVRNANDAGLIPDGAPSLVEMIYAARDFSVEVVQFTIFYHSINRSWFRSIEDFEEELKRFAEQRSA